MAETKKPARATVPPPVPARPVPLPPVRSEGGELIEDVNEQLGRFLEHADQLVEEWARFASDVRRTVDTEVARIDGAVAEATERALRNAAAQVDRVAADRIEKTVEHAVARWRGEPPAARVASGGGGTSASGASAAGTSRLLVGAVLVANLLLVVLIVMSLRKGAPASSSNGGGGGGASDGVTTIIAPEVLAACDSLAEGTWSPDEAALVLRAGTAVCGDDEAKVTATVTAHFAEPGSGEAPIDAGVVDATPPIDAKKRPGK
jgi:hypothetical protein